MAGVKLTKTERGWVAPNDQFVFRRMGDDWAVADYGFGVVMYPLVGAGGEGQHRHLAAAVAEAKELLVLEGRIGAGSAVNELAQIALAAVYEHFDGDLYAAFDEPVPFPRECPAGGVHDFAYPEDGQSRCRKCPCNVGPGSVGDG